MLRRDFLKAFSAFSAAVAAGVRMPSGREVQAAEPPAPLPALETPARSIQDEVIAKLAECQVVSIEEIHSVGGYSRYKIIYRLDKAAHFQGLNKEAEPFVKGRRPVEISVHCQAREVDVLDLGSYGKSFMPLHEPVYEFEVTWA